MADGLTLEVVTPDRQVVRGDATEVQLPAASGFLGILPGHTPLLAELGIGALSYKMGGETHYIAVTGGFAEVLPDRVTVLADAAERAEEIDVIAARAALEAARKTIASGPGNTELDWSAAQRYLTAATVRANLAEQYGKTAAGDRH